MEHPIIETTCGLITGYQKGDTLAFDGIPYCQPPTGPRRFLKADDSIHW